ncbi:signal peptide peptidase SppA [Thiomicrospira microaerophila]|uniref:signal peptide peptidase SppA n=1 Tax=Thiomicrospira microaerophila TaxID=406020 RepID=UPI00200C01CD|nr:signal peptide peptidase SppA [Thiomicrospira microaerophila]UQB41365.1 signal peptide peptidase SppA [Thiomicrospira microaerophila]
MEQYNPWTENQMVDAPAKNPKQPAALDRLADAADAYVKQERWSRRWTNVLKAMVVIYILVSIVMLAGFFSSNEKESLGVSHAAVIKINGAIMAGGRTSAEAINPLLREAFESSSAKAVVLYMNSPGGSPVQSALINDEITRLKTLHDKPVYVVAEDICASGCYYIAAAADKIFANKGSIIGSIGVRFDSFGFTDLMDKVGIENRSMTAGEYKSFINPFGAEDPEAKKFFQQRILERTHQQFIEVVRRGRGDRLNEVEGVFSGLVWLGDEAIEIGLIDGLGDLGSVVRDEIGLTRIREYEQKRSFIEHIMGDLVSETALRLSQSLTGLK